MYRDISIPLLVLTLLMPLLLILAHVLSCRLLKPEHASPQARLAKLIVVMNVLLLGGVWAVSQAENREISDTFFMLAFAHIVFNGIAYSYFHFFNMSETARRIRMLIQIREHGDEMSKQKMSERYGPESMVSARLERLVQMRQITFGEDGRCRLDGRLLVTIAYLMEWFKIILKLGRNSSA